MGIPAGDGPNKAAAPEERKSFLTTIVGGRPRPANQAAGNSLGVERVLLLAAGDGEFKARLLAEREAAIDESGVELSAAERAILLAAPEEQLREMIQRLTPAEPERREFLKKAAKTAAAGALLAIPWLFAEGCGGASTGVRPDRPEPTEPPPSSGPTEGIRPDRPVTQGIQPDRPEIESLPYRSVSGSTGIRVDRPKPAPPAEGGVRPDRP